VIGTTHQELIARTLNEAGWHAVGHDEGVDHHRPIWITQPRINYVDAADISGGGDAVFVCLQQHPGVGIPNHAT
jgi:hypothetical protein